VSKSISQHIVTFKIHKQSAQISISHGRIASARPGAFARENIKGFSYKSERRMRMVLEDTIHLYSHFCVLTYPSDFPLDGKTVKRNLHALIQLLRRQDIKDYFWGIEFQKRGAPHINILLPCAIDGDRLRKAWFKIVGSGDENHLTYGASIEEIRDKSKLSTYIVGYQYKRQQKDVPVEFQNVGRFWGSTRSSKASGMFTKRFSSIEALNEYIKPVIVFYEGQLKEWSEKSKKGYTWQYKGNSFTLWGGAEVINKFIIEGVINVKEK
jgi:hypothetical protein